MADLEGDDDIDKLFKINITIDLYGFRCLHSLGEVVSHNRLVCVCV